MVQADVGVKQTTESGRFLAGAQPLPNVVSMESVNVVPLGKALTVTLAP